MIGSPAGTMTLDEYLPSRHRQLTIHGLDIVRATGSQLSTPAEALRESLAFVTGWCVSKGAGEVVIQALSGRGGRRARFRFIDVSGKNPTGATAGHTGS